MIADEGLDTFAGGGEDGSTLRLVWPQWQRPSPATRSTATALAVMLVLRTNRRFWLSKPGRALLITSIAVAAIMLALSYSPLAGVLGLTAVPLRLLAALAGVSIGCIGVNEFVKVGTGLAA